MLGCSASPAKPDDWVDVESCPICTEGPLGFERFAKVPSEIGQLLYKIRRSCGLVFRSPRSSRTWLRRFYEGGYHVPMHGQHEPSAKTAWVETRRAAALVAFAGQHLRSVHKHLDIGSSMGRLMESTTKFYGCEARGIEPASAFRRQAHQSGLRVTGRLADLEAAERRSFDLISMSHVLEHVVEPLEFLRRIGKNWLAERGHILIEVSNLFGHPFFELPHLATFTKETLHRLLGTAGYAVVDMHTDGAPYSRRLPFFIRTIARKADKPPRVPGRPPSLAAIRIHRWEGMLRLRATWWIASKLLSREQLKPWAGE